MITTSKFGFTKDGREVLAFTIADGDSFVTILNYGGVVQSLVVPAANGEPTDVVLGYNDVASYEGTGGYLGALIGRFGNRIGEGKLTIDGETYTIKENRKNYAPSFIIDGLSNGKHLVEIEAKDMSLDMIKTSGVLSTAGDSSEGNKGGGGCNGSYSVGFAGVAGVVALGAVLTMKRSGKKEI